MESESRLKIAIFIATLFMFIEIIGGYIASSLAIYSDAAHLLSDIAGFMIALYAAFVTKRKKCSIRTFGYDRAEVIGSIFSILCLWFVTVYLLFCASFRAWDWFQGRGIEIDGKFMFYTALFGVFVNIVLINVFHSEHMGLTHDHSHDHELSYDIIDENGGSFRDVESPCHECENDSHSDHDHSHSHVESHTHSHDNHTYAQIEAVEVAPASVPTHAPQTAAFLSPLRAGSLKPTMSAVKPSASKPMDSALKYKVMDDFADDNSPFRSSPVPAALTNASTSLAKTANISTPTSTSMLINERTSLLSTANAQNTNTNGNCNNHDHGHNHSNGHDHAHENSLHEQHTDTTDTHHHHGHGEDSNLKAAFLHVVTDMIQSIGVAIAGAVVWWRPQWGIVDPLCTFLFSALVMLSTFSLFRAQMNILMEGVPEHVCSRSINIVVVLVLLVVSYYDCDFFIYLFIYLCLIICID